MCVTRYLGCQVKPDLGSLLVSFYPTTDPVLILGNKLAKQTTSRIGYAEAVNIIVRAAQPPEGGRDRRHRLTSRRTCCPGDNCVRRRRRTRLI